MQGVIIVEVEISAVWTNRSDSVKIGEWRGRGMIKNGVFDIIDGSYY